MNLITQTENSVICNSCSDELILKNLVGHYGLCKCESVRLVVFKNYVQYCNLHEEKSKQMYHKLFQRT
jgi:hypothetical protein